MENWFLVHWIHDIDFLKKIFKSKNLGDKKYVYSNIFFDDLPPEKDRYFADNLPITIGLVLNKNVLLDKGGYFNTYWTGEVNDKSLIIKKHDKNISKKIKLIRKLLKLQDNTGLASYILTNEIIIRGKIPLKYLMGIFCFVQQYDEITSLIRKYNYEDKIPLSIAVRNLEYYSLFFDPDSIKQTDWFLYHQTWMPKTLEDVLKSKYLYAMKLMPNKKHDNYGSPKYVYFNIFFDDVPPEKYRAYDREAFAELGFIIHKNALLDNGGYFNRGWRAGKISKETMKIKKHDPDIENKLKIMKREIHNKTRYGVDQREGLEGYKGSHEIMIADKVSIDKYLIGLFCPHRKSLELVMSILKKYGYEDKIRISTDRIMTANYYT
jgi:hypothetical protein